MSRTIHLPLLNKIQKTLNNIVDHPWFQRMVITLVIVNAVTLGMETSDRIMASYGPYLHALDQFILTIFVIEISMRFMAKGLPFFKSGWNWLDIVVVGISLIPDASAFSALRTLRVLRILRLISVIPALRKIVSSLISAVPGLSYIILLMMVMFYIFSVVATHLFGDAFPQWFGTLGDSMFSLFQIMTLESWSMGIVRPVMQVHPWAWAFFVPFILLTSFTVLNLFIAVIVNALQAEEAEEARKTRIAIRETAERTDKILHQDIKAMHDEIKELRRLVEGK